MRIDHRLTRTQRPWLVSVAGAVGAVALHLLLLSALSLEMSAGEPPKRQGDPSGIAMPNADDRSVSTLIFIDPTVLSGDQGFAAPGVRIKPPTLRDIQVARLARLAAIQSSLQSDGDAAQADGAERAMLLGRYVNQLSARIEALWVRPRSAPSGTSIWSPAVPRAAGGTAGVIGAVSFRCSVQILRAGDGKVLEITLLDCDSSPEWQQSLVNAIDAASPLPAPPNKSLVARSLVLDFTSTGRIP